MGYSDIKELLKDAKDIATGANDLQLKSKLLDIQDFVFELQEQNKELRDELNDLKNMDILTSELEYKNNAYYRNEDYEKPYCTKCFDVDKHLVIMKKWVSIHSRNYKFNCPNCKNDVDSTIEHHKDISIRF